MITNNCKQSMTFLLWKIEKCAVKAKLEFWSQNSSFGLLREVQVFCTFQNLQFSSKTSSFQYTETLQYFLKNEKLEFCYENLSFGLTEKLPYFKLLKPPVLSKTSSFHFELENFQVFIRNVKTRVLIQNSSFAFTERNHTFQPNFKTSSFLTLPPVLVLNNFLKFSQVKWKLEFSSRLQKFKIDKFWKPSSLNLILSSIILYYS